VKQDLIKFGFSAGVLDPKLHGRGDLRNYDLGLAEGRNWCVDYLGGAFTRPGTEYRETAFGDVDLPARLIPFQFNNDIANTYLILIANTEIYFLQDGNYVLNLGVPYTIASPYAAADLPLLKYSQDGDVIYLNHPTYAERKLTRISATNWTIGETSFVSYSATTSSVVGNPSSAGTAGMVFAVTPVNSDGFEGVLGADSFEIESLSVDYTSVAGHFSLAWSRIAGAVSYNIYRSLIIPSGTEAHVGMDLGFVGSSQGAGFVDNNIVPDFTRSPPEYDNPFAPGAIEYIHVTAAGSGYDGNFATVSVSGGGGSGFVGIPIVSSGAVIGVKILNPGSGYVSPTVTINPNGFGSGATATAVARAAFGTYPSCAAKVQQRRVRAGTNNNPLGIYGSRIGEPDAYNSSNVGLASDPYILTIDAETQTPIRHLMTSTEGFFAFCDDGVFLVRGVDDSAITITSAKSSSQTADGAAHVRPLKIDREILYLTTEFDAIQAIGPSNLPTYFTTTDRSVLSSHYFDADNAVNSLTWAKAPHRLIWASREDGTFLSCAYIAVQEVFAWTDHTTAGKVSQFVTIRENGYDRVYCLVERNIDGTRTRFIERLSLQEPETEEDMWAVDSGVRSPLTYPAASLTVSGLSGLITITAGSGIFSAGDVGKAFRAGGGRGQVTTHLSATQLEVQLDIDIRQPIPELSTRTFASGEWSLTPLFSTFSGLDHLEGQVVEILADGAVVANQTVVGGEITLEEPASYVLAGLGFTSRLKTLPISISGTVLEGKEKAVRNLAVRLFKARGLRFGDSVGDITYPLPQRNYETYGVAPSFKSGMYEVSIRAGFELDGSVVIDKEGPQSASVLGLVMGVEIEG
jgi:hypothetical protein